MDLNRARHAYMGASVATADPQRLLVMLCDRLVLDVTRGATALADGDTVGHRQHLFHAQDIVSELRTSLDVDGFAGGRELAALYDYVFARLASAVIHHDLPTTQECQALTESIADTWRQAALLAMRSA